MFSLAVPIPDDFKVILAAGVGWIVTEGLKALGALFKIDLSGKAAAVTAALVTAIVFFANELLAKIPAQYDPVVSSIFALLVAVLGAYGIHRQFALARKINAAKAY